MKRKPPEKSNPSEKKRQEFTFTDRTGKVHKLGGGRSPSPHRTEQADRWVEQSTEPVLDGKRSSPREQREEVYRPKRISRQEFKQKKKAARQSRGRPQGQIQRLKASVDKNRKGFAFLAFENRSLGLEDAFVPPQQAEALFHGDRVEVAISSRGQIHSIKVLEHRFRELVGRYEPNPSPKAKGSGFVVYERKKAREEIYVPKAVPGLKSGDWVRAKLQFHDEGSFNVTAEITEVYGESLPASADLAMVAAEYSLQEEHPADAEREAARFTLDLDLKHRTDLRNVPFITIDGETARDFDDAVFVERDRSGFILWVAIADVSHYVTEGSALDRDARSRGTSVYFPEKAFHMLPRALSENLCSLRPHEPRLSMVAKMFYDRTGQRTRTEVMEALIESRRRATYTEIQREWELNQKNKDWEYLPHFHLYQLIRKTRSERGSIDFDLPEAELKVDAGGEPISITNRERLDAHRLIEEFMIAANEAVTEWMMAKGFPFVYRVHDEPADQSLQKFQKLAATVGVSVSLSERNRQQSLATLVRKIVGHPAEALLNMSLLRSMKQAVYSAVYGKHFGLASEGYTHFTSPIRRYPDLVVHRLIRMALQIEAKRQPGLKKHTREKLEEELVEIAEHCSYRERIAADAERESIKLKQVRIMLKRLGEEFDAKVVGMTDNGLFVQIQNPYVEGMISKDSMQDDFYEFNEDKMIFFGRRKRRTFKIGDPVRVIAARADIDRRILDFTLSEQLARHIPPR